MDLFSLLVEERWKKQYLIIGVLGARLYPTLFFVS